MIDLKQYINSPDLVLLQNDNLQPWELIDNWEGILLLHLSNLGIDYVI